MIKIGVIGYGNSAQTFHLPLIEASNSLQLVAVSTRQANIVKQRYPDISIYPTAQQLIQNSDAELVVITAPNNVHYPLAKACLESGKHVVLEKPMVTSTAQAEKLSTLAKTRGLIVSTFHNRRWDGDFLTVKKLLKDGALGDIHFFESHFDRYRPIVTERWKEQAGPGSGIWFDLGSHLLDQALCLFGTPEAITARFRAQRDHSKVTDYFHVLLHYTQCDLVLHASSFCAGPNERFNIQGSKGSFIKHGLDPQENQLKNGMSPNDDLFGCESAGSFGTFYSESSSKKIHTERGCYQTYYKQITESVVNRTAPPVSPEDGAQVIKLLELAESSNQQGKTLGIYN